jgi:hypothetical protein
MMRYHNMLCANANTNTICSQGKFVPTVNFLKTLDSFCCIVIRTFKKMMNGECEIDSEIFERRDGFGLES